MAAALTLVAGVASAQSVDRQIHNQLSRQGFTNIEIERDDGRIEVEARRGNQKVELVYDARTGRLIRQEINRDRNTTRPGATVTRRGNDDDDDRGGRRGRDDDDDGRDDDDDDRGGRGGRDDDDDDRGGNSGGRDDDDDDRGGNSGGRDDDDDDRGGNDDDD